MHILGPCILLFPLVMVTIASIYTEHRQRRSVSSFKISWE